MLRSASPLGAAHPSLALHLNASCAACPPRRRSPYPTHALPRSSPNETSTSSSSATKPPRVIMRPPPQQYLDPATLAQFGLAGTTTPDKTIASPQRRPTSSNGRRTPSESKFEFDAPRPSRAPAPGLAGVGAVPPAAFAGDKRSYVPLKTAPSASTVKEGDEMGVDGDEQEHKPRLAPVPPIEPRLGMRTCVDGQVGRGRKDYSAQDRFAPRAFVPPLSRILDLSKGVTESETRLIEAAWLCRRLECPGESVPRVVVPWAMTTGFCRRDGSGDGQEQRILEYWSVWLVKRVTPHWCAPANLYAHLGLRAWARLRDV
ncbi:hypothetical protein FRC10_007865 [Ceratobasidium sp. 414]|nr:hypothetical protein FRC10_007865 [Ceratobasidium sp. 414]